MPRGVTQRRSDTYSPMYMKAYQHVLRTNQPLEVHSLKSRGQCVSMRQSMFAYRNALEREGSPVASQLYSVTISIFCKDHPSDPRPIELGAFDRKGLDKTQGKWYLVIRPRDRNFQDALEGLEELKGLGDEPVPVGPAHGALDANAQPSIPRSTLSSPPPVNPYEFMRAKLESSSAQRVIDQVFEDEQEGEEKKEE